MEEAPFCGVMMRASESAFVAFLVALAPLHAHADDAVPPRRRVAVFPVDAFSASTALVPRLRMAMESRVKSSLHLELVSPEHVDRMLSSRSLAGDALAGCVEDLTCVRGLGEVLEADVGLVGRVAGLGDTHVFELRLVDLDRALLEREAREVVSDHPELVAGALVDTLLPAPERSPEWYERWWVWASALAVVAAGATTIAIVSSSDDNAGRLVIQL